MRSVRFYIIIFFCGYISREICSTLFDVLQNTKLGDIIIRDDYTVKEFIFWIGEPLQGAIWAYGFWTIIVKTTLGKYLVRWYIDWLIIDVGYLIFSNPYILNRSKWECVGLTVLLFIAHCIVATKIKKKKLL